MTIKIKKLKFSTKKQKVILSNGSIVYIRSLSYKDIVTV